MGDRYERRYEQEMMVDRVRHALGNGQTLLVEAGTGVGKTFAYLLPAIELIVAGARGGDRRRLGALGAGHVDEIDTGVRQHARQIARCGDQRRVTEIDYGFSAHVRIISHFCRARLPLHFRWAFV